jgi:hypothetical protein
MPLSIGYFLPMPIITPAHVDKKVELTKKLCEKSPQSKECNVSWEETWELISEQTSQKDQKKRIDRITELMRGL